MNSPKVEIKWDHIKNPIQEKASKEEKLKTDKANRKQTAMW